MCKRKAITKRQRSIFLDVLRSTGNVSASSRAANISSRSAHTLKGKDEDFASEWELAKEEALDELEAALRKRAIEGVEKPVYYAGKECGTQRSYSDSVGMYILKTHRGGLAEDGLPKGGKVDVPARSISAKELLLEKLESMARNIEDKIPEQADGD